MNSLKEEKVNQLMVSLSGIDGDLLADVAPAAPARGLARKKSIPWKTWTRVAAGLAVLFVTAFVIRLALGGGMTADKAPAPMEVQEAGNFGREESKDAANLPEPGMANRDIHELAKKLDDLDLMEKVSSGLLCGCGADNRLYSPLGLYASLLAGEGQAEPEAEAGQDLMEAWAKGADRKLVNHFEYRPRLDGLIQELSFSVHVGVLSEVPDRQEGIDYYQLPRAEAFFRDRDQTVFFKVPIQGGQLHIAFPDPIRSTDELLSERGFFSRLLDLQGPGQEAILVMPALSMEAELDWTREEGQEAWRAAGGLDQDLSFHGQKVRLDFLPDEVKGDLSKTDSFLLDRPFIFLVTDEGGLPLLAGVLRDPISS